MAGVHLRVLEPPPEAITPDWAEVMRYLGYRPGRSELTPKVEAVVDAGIAGALATAAPKVSAGYCSLLSVQADVVTLAVPGFSWQTKELARRLAGARAVTLLVATAGDGPAERVRQLFAEGEYAVATAVDAAAAALVHALVRWATGVIGAEAAERGYSLTPPYSPGYGDWDIMSQRDLVEAVGGSAGVTCTPTCYLIPEKSMVAMVGWTGADAEAAASGCAACLQSGCLYRQAPPRLISQGEYS